MNILLKFFKGLSLLLVFSLNAFLLLLDSGDSLAECLLRFLFLLLESFFVSLNGLLHLIVVFLYSLLLEGKSLVFESLFSLRVDLALGQFIHSFVVLLLKFFNLSNLRGLFLVVVVLNLVECLLLILGLLEKAILGILKR